MIIAFFILGLIIGSFLNVVIYRIHVAEDLFFDRSKCPHCKKMIPWYDNIPVISFILLKFKCRYCRKKISWQYPLIEISTGIIFALIGYYFFQINNFSSWLITSYYLGLASFLLVIFIYDLLYMEIPASVLWLSVFWSLAFLLALDWQNNNLIRIWESGVYSGILAAMVGFLFFFSLVVVSKEKWMGMGDAYLAILLGLILGWPKIILGIFMAFLIGSIYGIILITLKRKNLKSQIPFAPFLIIGSLIAMLFYQPIVSWYWGLIYF